MRNSVCNKLFKADLCCVTSFREDLKQAEDLFFNIDALEKSKCIQTISKAFYFYNKLNVGKLYYDKDAQMAYDRNKAICNRIVNLGVDPDQAMDEYYHKVIDTAYDKCMLILRTTDLDNKADLVNDVLNKLDKLRIPKRIDKLTPQQEIILIAKHIKNKQAQFLFLEVVRRTTCIIRFSANARILRRIVAQKPK